MKKFWKSGVACRVGRHLSERFVTRSTEAAASAPELVVMELINRCFWLVLQHCRRRWSTGYFREPWREDRRNLKWPSSLTGAARAAVALAAVGTAAARGAAVTIRGWVTPNSFGSSSLKRIKDIPPPSNIGLGEYPSRENPWTILEPSLNHPWTILEPSLNHPWTILGRSLDGPWTVLGLGFKIINQNQHWDFKMVEDLLHLKGSRKDRFSVDWLESNLDWRGLTWIGLELITLN